MNSVERSKAKFSAQRRLFVSSDPTATAVVELPTEERSAGAIDMTGVPEGSCACSVCGIEKDNKEFSFYKDRYTADGYRLRTNTNCRSCSNKLSKQRARLRKKVTEPRPQPGTPCACCGKPADKHEFDHDHETEKFRGYICKDCNVGLGKFGDNSEGLIAPLMYLFDSESDEQKRRAVEKLTEYISSGK
jgi:hypothetical protein